MRQATQPAESMYRLCNTGTEEDRERDMQDLLKLIGNGFVGFAEDFSREIIVYKPLSLGLRQRTKGRFDRAFRQYTEDVPVV